MLIFYLLLTFSPCLFMYLLGNGPIFVTIVMHTTITLLNVRTWNKVHINVLYCLLMGKTWDYPTQMDPFYIIEYIDFKCGIFKCGIYSCLVLNISSLFKR